MFRRACVCGFVFVGLCALSPGVAVAQHHPAPDGLPKAVYFQAEPSFEQRPGWNSLLGREVMRQAVLLAAREELGLVTRDAALDEPRPDGAPAVLIQTHIQSRYLTLTLHGLEPAPPAVQERMPVDIPRAPGFRRQVTVLERWSREKLPQLLHDAGFEGQPNAANPDAALPADIEPLVPELNLVAQFDLVRRAHAAMRRDERRLDRVGIRMRVPWENWQDIYTEVIDVLAKEGADIICDVTVVAKGDSAIRENTVELVIRESLSQRGIDAEIETG